MKNCLEIYSADATFELPIRASEDGRTFWANQPACVKELNISEVRLVSERNDLPLRFLLGSFTLMASEAGTWTVNISENEFGAPQYHLEYYATEQGGQRVPNPAVMHWNHNNDEMTTD